MSPTILRVEGYRFYFYSSDRPEPPHVHVVRGGSNAKFWLDPVELVASYGFNVRELNRIEELVRENQARLLEAWRKYFGEEV